MVGTDLEGNQYLEVEARGMTIVTILNTATNTTYVITKFNVFFPRAHAR